MKAVLFYDNELYIERWKNILGELIALDSIKGEYASIFEPYHMEDSFFSIFLLTPQQAASKPLLKTVKALMEVGAHQRSLLFLINDKDQVDLEEREAITREVSNTLSSYVKDPEILWCSSNGYHLYQAYKNNPEDEALKKEVRYTYWDQEGEPLTLQDLMKGHEMSFVLEDSGIPAFLTYIREQIIPFPQRANRRDPSKRHLMFLGNSTLIRETLAEQSNVIVHEVDQLEKLEREVAPTDFIIFAISFDKMAQFDFEKLANFSPVIVLIDGGNQQNIWEIDNEKIPEWTEKYQNMTFLAVNSFYIECLKAGKAREELVESSFIVIRGQHGLPVFKDEIINWDEALFQESGMSDVMKLIS